ncbi:MAG: DUF445 family protein [Proteobacteria bacterium]|nr:DUF445 family protein [Pseudomonadota bacterium]MBU1649437.1 DUF445 family protein [Pseudomonadota bacterium]
MSIVNADLVTVLTYATPPVVGAFIGYLTNKVAIKMLFRPLKAWRVFGVRVPLTPGVIPSKRGELAVNIGEMVGEHLLTSKEIGQALTNESFQTHLHGLIESRGSALLNRDLGPLSSLIPKGYQSYFDVAVKAVTHQAQEGIHFFVASSAFAVIVESALDQQFERLLKTRLSEIFPGKEREEGYAFIEKNLARMLANPAMEQWLETFVQQKVYATLSQEKSLADILPESLQDLVVNTIEEQTPALLGKFAVVLSEPEIRDKIVRGVRVGVENFIASMGPMAGMVKTFLSMETVEKKVREYLIDKEDEIVDWLQNGEVQQRVSTVLRERSQAFLATPLVKMVGSIDATDGQGDKVERFCSQLSLQLAAFLREPETTTALASMIRDNLETHMESGGLSLGETLQDLMGETGTQKGKRWIKNEILAILRSGNTRTNLNFMTQTLLQDLLSRPIGRLSALLPAGVRDGLYLSIQKMASDMLAVEVPGLVASLNLKQIVKEKVDSLDLMRLERLLLSIMEEQFKYINLFGAILGFLIGCLNVLFLTLF